MKKQIIVETPLDCPYNTELPNYRKGRWCNYRGYDKCFKTKFPSWCPLDDFQEDKE